MRFYFDIDDYEFSCEEAPSFKEVIKQGAVMELAAEIYANETNPDRWRSEVSEQIKNIVKEHSTEIIEEVIERVSEKIAAKKALVAITPKASELDTIDKDNVTYFEKMIDKAIARRFGKQVD